MRADTTCDLTTLERDLQSEQVTIRYRDGSEEKEVGTGRAPCGKSLVEIVMRPTLVVWKQCNCQMCDRNMDADEDIPICIPVRDAVDIDVRELEDAQVDERPHFELEPLARWLRSRFGQLKRLALDD
jgi:hypothetical protein